MAVAQIFFVIALDGRDPKSVHQLSSWDNAGDADTAAQEAAVGTNRAVYVQPAYFDDGT